MLKKLKKAIKAVKVATVAEDAAAAYAVAEPSEASYSAYIDAYVAARNAFDDYDAGVSGDVAREKVRKILEKMLVKYQ